MRFARPAAIALFVLVMAVTPLSAFFSGGVFETSLPAQYHRGPVWVVFQDQTGLVKGIASADPDQGDEIVNPAGNQRLLLVRWSGDCGGEFKLDMTFARAGGGYVVRAHASSLACTFFSPAAYGTVAISLWAPVDAASVRFELLR